MQISENSRAQTFRRSLKLEYPVMSDAQLIVAEKVSTIDSEGASEAVVMVN